MSRWTERADVASKRLRPDSGDAVAPRRPRSPAWYTGLVPRFSRGFAPLVALGLATGCTAARVHSAEGVPRFAELADAPPSTLASIDIERFRGRWYVVRSNFEFWTKRDRSDPSFVYEPIPDAAVVKLDDRVDFRQRGRARKYDGVDLQDPTRAGHFQWRGDGALYGVVNQWYVVHVEPDDRWAIIYFSKSNFGTGAGVEVIARAPTLDAEDDARARAIIAADPFLRPRAQGMFAPRHGASR